MCELFALSARFPTTVRGSIEELARHGGGTGPHRDGWGVGFVQDGDALLIREPGAANDSACLAFLERQDIRSALVLAHIRRATQGAPSLRNTQPFARELGGRIHLFAHNGMLPGVEQLSTRRFRRVGDTDSEHAFCALMERMAPLWEAGVPSLDERLATVAEVARELRGLGPANFLYADGDALFAHGHRRRGDDGAIRPPGLHVLCRSCAAGFDGVPATIAAAGEQRVALVASVPLSSERWQTLDEGEIVVLQAGRIVRTSPARAAPRHGLSH
jgi:glutamine amidotransferase